VIPIAACAAAVAVLLAGEWRGSRPLVWIAKPLASAAFVWTAIGAGAPGSGHGRFVLAGLALCACGDVLLIPRGSQRAFVAGIGAFLLGHVAYAAGFLWQGVAVTALLAAGVAGAFVGILVLRWLGPLLPADLRRPVRAYVAVILAMVACAVGAAVAGAPAIAAAGAVAFAASDLSVARDRFGSAGFANVAWGLPLYYAAQLALGASTGCR
jgi:uncharacterized membrane protein YhhN